jgi:hypothetical protein
MGKVRVITPGYGHGSLPAIRVERFVERSSGLSQRSECHQCG